MQSEVKNSIVMEVPAGSTTVLNCHSNDFEHNFMFWLFGPNKIIGPGNDYDERKYKYEVLSGKLHINNVSPAESGYYRCISKKFDDSGVTVGQVELKVTGSTTFSSMEAVKLAAIVLSILVLIVCAMIYFRLRRSWRNVEGHKVIPVDEPDEEEEGDEIYNSTTTSINQPVPGPSRGPSRNVSSELLYGIDNQGLDTDFNSVFENIQIKSPEPSLI